MTFSEVAEMVFGSVTLFDAKTVLLMLVVIVLAVWVGLLLKIAKPDQRRSCKKYKV